MDFCQLVSCLIRECLASDREALLTVTRLGMSQQLERLCPQIQPQDGLHTFNACLVVAAQQGHRSVVTVLLDYIRLEFPRCKASTGIEVWEAIRLEEKDFLTSFEIGPLELRQEVWWTGQAL